MASEMKRKMKAIVKDPEHCSRVVRSLQSFNSQQNYTDLCFVCARGLKVYAHKLLVCSVSTQLKELLLQLPDNLSKITIHVPDINSRILQLIINLLYEGNVRVSRRDYDKFKDIMNFLGIVLEPPSKTDDDTGRNEDPPPPPPAPPATAPQILYLPNPTSSQGGVQYVLAPSSMVQGSLMSPVVQPTTVAQPSSFAQSLVIPASAAQVQAGNQMVQLIQSPGGQVMPFSSQMLQTINGQMVQPFNGHLVQPANQAIQSDSSQMLLPDNQMVRPVNNQIFQPGNNQMVEQTANQMVNGAQMVVQRNRHTIINNNTTQVNLQNQSEARGRASSIGFRHSDSTFSVRKRNHLRVRPHSSMTHQPNLATVRDRAIMRRSTGPIVTGVHSLANMPGNRSVASIEPGTASGTGPIVLRRSQNSFM